MGSRPSGAIALLSRKPEPTRSLHKGLTRRRGDAESVHRVSASLCHTVTLNLPRKRNPVPPVSVDVVAILPEGWGLCNSCELLMARANLDQAPPDRGLDDYPPEWRTDFQRLSALIYD